MTPPTPEDLRERFGLTDKQAKWALAMVSEPGISGVEACRRAGYSGSYSYLGVTANRLVKNDKVRDACRWMRPKITDTPGIMSAAEVLKSLSALAKDSADGIKTKALALLLDAHGLKGGGAGAEALFAELARMGRNDLLAALAGGRLSPLEAALQVLAGLPGKEGEDNA